MLIISKKYSKRSFTLIEIFIILTLIIILIGVLIFVIQPEIILRRGRDNRRISDIKTLNNVIELMSTTMPNFRQISYVSPNVVYISLPDTSTSCASYQNELPSLPSGWSYRCSANPTLTNGQGWIPINFSASPFLKINKLPIDPINKPPYYYSFTFESEFKLKAYLESGNELVLTSPGRGGEQPPSGGEQPPSGGEQPPSESPLQPPLE